MHPAFSFPDWSRIAERKSGVAETDARWPDYAPVVLSERQRNFKTVVGRLWSKRLFLVSVRLYLIVLVGLSDGSRRDVIRYEV